jgi:uroporphyrinogen III methyltransferase/synthase
VGCGPGALDLLTLRAIEVLKKADVVFYDRLVDQRVLRYAKKAKKVYCGKRGSEAWKQARVNERLYREARGGKAVVRLKNGDPFVFGRGGEELQHLRERGIEVEVVPGLSSALALPGLAKIPLTQRDLSSSLSIVSGRGAGGKKPHWSGLGDTVIVLMALENLDWVVHRLVLGGKTGKTPCVLISRGAMAGERMFVSALNKIAGAARRLGFKPPAVLVVGKVVSTLLDVKGQRVAVFRASDEVKRTERLIKRAGGTPNVFEICDIEPADGPLQRAAKQKWDALVFTSANGVRWAVRFFDLKNHATVAVGDRTKRELEHFGCKHVLVPKEQDVKGVEKLLKRRKWRRVLALRSPLAKDKLANAVNIPAYHIKFKNLKRTISNYTKTKDDFTLLTSAGLLEYLLKAADKFGLKRELVRKMNRTFVISLGTGITECALRNGIEVNHEPKRPTLDLLFREGGS